MTVRAAWREALTFESGSANN